MSNLGPVHKKVFWADLGCALAVEPTCAKHNPFIYYEMATHILELLVHAVTLWCAIPVRRYLCVPRDCAFNIHHYSDLVLTTDFLDVLVLTSCEFRARQNQSGSCAADWLAFIVFQKRATAPRSVFVSNALFRLTYIFCIESSHKSLWHSTFFFKAVALWAICIHTPWKLYPVLV